MIYRVIAINDFGYTKLAWLAFMYVVGAYIRLYGEKIIYEKSIMTILALLSFLVITVSTCISGLTLSNGKSILDMIINHIIAVFADNSLNSFMSLFFSLFAFACFINLKINSELFAKIAQLFAGTTFRVYLIHDNIYFRDFLWYKIFAISDIEKTQVFPVACCIIVFVVFLMCSMIDYLRKKYVKKPVMNNRLLNIEITHTRDIFCRD